MFTVQVSLAGRQASSVSLALPWAPGRASTSLSLLADGMTYYSCPDFFYWRRIIAQTRLACQRDLEVSILLRELRQVAKFIEDGFQIVGIEDHIVLLPLQFRFAQRQAR